MEKREDTVLDMDIYRFERNGARENAGSNPEDVSTGCPGADLPLYPHGVGLYESSLQLAIFILKPLG
jgi:hypothetical protein